MSNSTLTPPDRPSSTVRADSGRRMAERREARLAERERLRTSKFDVVTSFFMALILFIGTFTFMLFIVWLTLRTPTRVKPIEPIIENPAGRGENAEGFERDFEPPGAEEVEELLEPTLADTIEAVTDAVSSVAAALDTMDTNATASTSGTGQGDNRPPGPEGEGEDIIPRFERWQLNWTSKGIQPYSEQLDYYGIELGATGPPIQGIHSVSNLSTSPKARLDPDSENEKRLYFMWTSPSPLKVFDEQLLAKAGVTVQGRQMMKFVPEQLENALAQTEMAYLKSKGHSSITVVAKTIFESKPAGNGYEFQVVDQRYRK